MREVLFSHRSSVLLLVFRILVSTGCVLGGIRVIWLAMHGQSPNGFLLGLLLFAIGLLLGYSSATRPYFYIQVSESSVNWLDASGRGRIDWEKVASITVSLPSDDITISIKNVNGTIHTAKSECLPLRVDELLRCIEEQADRSDFIFDNRLK